MRTSDGDTGGGGWYIFTGWSPAASDGKWLMRDGVGGLNTNGVAGKGAGYYTFQHDSGTTPPGITTTMSGLNPMGLYDVYVFYEAATRVSSGIKAAISGDVPVEYTPAEGTNTGIAAAGGYVYRAMLASSEQAVGAQIAVDVESRGSGYNRYDGLSYDFVGTVATTTSTTSATTNTTTSTSTSTTTTVAGDGLILHYAFDTDDGEIVTNQSGNGHKGLLHEVDWVLVGLRR